MKQEHKLRIQDTIDRLLYCGEAYEKALNELNAKYNPHKDKNYSNNPSEFKFPLEEAI
jgi:hypothetical protein